jgi:hypothetical protein
MPSADGHRRARGAVLAFFAEMLEYDGDPSDLAFDPERDRDDPETGGLLDKAMTPYARWGIGRYSPELVGFWLLWHAEGGFEGMRRLGMSETTIWRRVRAFRDAFGQHPDDYDLPGVSVDLKAYWLHPDGHGFLGNPPTRPSD